MNIDPAEAEIPVRTHSKDEFIKILKEESPPIEGEEKYAQIMVVVEIKKIRKDLGIIKGEYYESDKLEYRASFLVPLVPLSKQPSDKPSVWDDLNEGENKFYGFTFDSREMKVIEKIHAFFKRSLEGASIQDFIPGARRKEE